MRHDVRFASPGMTPSSRGEPLPSPPETGQLRRVVLEGETERSLPPALEAERAQAVADLEASNHFLLPNRPGPYHLRLSIQQGRLVFDIRHTNEQPLVVVGLALGPFRRLIKDYHLLVESYEQAIKEGREARIQAIDMGRRGLHNEGAGLMMERLKGKIAIDLDTARRLFTLVCVLHQRM